MRKLSQAKIEELNLHKHLSKKYYRIREKNKHYLYFNDNWIEEYKKLVPKQSYKKTLDLGCGTVEFYELITKNLKSTYTGVDLSPDMLKVGKSKYQKIKLYEADAENLPFKNNSFDLVVGRGIIHHLPDPKKGCQEAFRVLKKGGYFIVSEPHSNLLLHFIRQIYYRLSSHFSHTHKSFYKEEFINLLKDSGFKIRAVKYWGLLSFPFAFPDILPTYKLMPFSLFMVLVEVDKFLANIPIINSFCWHLIVLCEKYDRKN